MSNIDNQVTFYSSYNVHTIYNQPSNPTVFTISQPYLITGFHNYHYLNNGKLPGTIGLKDNQGNTYGPWQTTGVVGRNNVKNAYWLANPYVIIPPGMYTVVDSDPSTWAQNAESGNCGFSELVGVLWQIIATAGDSRVTLTWPVVSGATGCNVKRSTTAGGPYTTITSNVSGTSYVDTSVTNGTTYYYVVTAVTTDGESDNSNEASATPVATVVAPTGNALLRVTMLDSSEREYRVSTTEIDGFVNWYTRTIGTGSSCYALKDIVDNSKEYLAFEKIISFKVMEIK